MTSALVGRTSDLSIVTERTSRKHDRALRRSQTTQPHRRAWCGRARKAQFDAAATAKLICLLREKMSGRLAPSLAFDAWS